MKRAMLILSAMAVLALGQPVLAIPSLQTFIPSATWDAGTQTWVTNAGTFELWVIAANTDAKPIFDLTLVGALDQNQAPVASALSIDGADIDAFTYGTPPSWGDNAGDYPPHGIYPTNYFELSVAALVDDAPETVHNMQPGEYDDTAPGKIFKFEITTTYDWLHFDSYGFLREQDGLFKFSPNSHDAEKRTPPPPSVPEPGTMLLFGSALALVGVVRKFQK
ncbi:MAG: PEP-CTERM sorting domain-containing protein [candidate division Zixibacteria bacterium]|nr:PEP-CTERM sorting domain-containing protein [candidate division Zixibacteria bacterium]